MPSITLRSRSFGAVLLVLLSITLFTVGQGALWAYGERIGMAGGLDAQAVGNALAITAGSSLLGAALSAWMDVRCGRFWPILVAILAQLVALGFLVGELEFLLFSTLLAIFAFSWNFGIAFQLGVLVSIDPRGRYVSLFPALQGIGLAVGPLLASLVIAGGDYRMVNAISGVALVSYLLLILPFSARRG